MTDNNINWDATAFFASLTEKNKFAKAHDFVFARISGLDGFEEVLQQLQSATAIVAVSDISQGYIGAHPIYLGGNFLILQKIYTFVP